MGRHHDNAEHHLVDNKVDYSFNRKTYLISVHLAYNKICIYQDRSHGRQGVWQVAPVHGLRHQADADLGGSDNEWRWRINKYESIVVDKSDICYTAVAVLVCT